MATCILLSSSSDCLETYPANGKLLHTGTLARYWDQSGTFPCCQSCRSHRGFMRCRHHCHYYQQSSVNTIRAFLSLLEYYKRTVGSPSHDWICPVIISESGRPQRSTQRQIYTSTPKVAASSLHRSTTPLPSLSLSMDITSQLDGLYWGM